jgi:hypothetical protein
MWTGCICLGIGTNGRLLGTRNWSFGFHKRRGISWLAEWLLASPEELCSMDSVSVTFSYPPCLHLPKKTTFTKWCELLGLGFLLYRHVRKCSQVHSASSAKGVNDENRGVMVPL